MGIIFLHKQGYHFLQQTRDIFIKKDWGIFPQSNGVKFYINDRGYLYQHVGGYFYINMRVSFYSIYTGINTPPVSRNKVPRMRNNSYYYQALEYRILAHHHQIGRK